MTLKCQPGSVEDQSSGGDEDLDFSGDTIDHGETTVDRITGRNVCFRQPCRRVPRDSCFSVIVARSRHLTAS